MSDPTKSASPHQAHDQHDHGGIGKYLVVFAALCILTGASFFTYSPYWPFKETPAIGWAFMMAVSCTKAMLVISFFMHLFWEASWKYVLTIPAAMISLFLILMLIPDVGLRTRHYTEQRWLHSAQPRANSEHADHNNAHPDDQEEAEKHGSGGDHH